MTDIAADAPAAGCQLRSEADLHRSAVELVDTVLIGLDSDQRIVLFNSEATRLTGYDQAEVVGESFRSLLVPPQGGLSEALDEVASLGPGAVRPLTPNVLINTRRGTMRKISGAIRRSVEDGEYAFVVARDVTLRTAVEARLRRSEKLAAIGTLAAGLAHEIRNPLNGAQLHVTVLQRGLQRLEGTDALRSAADVVQSEIRRLGDLVSDFLDFARPRALIRSQVVLQTLCTRCVDLLQSEARAANVELTITMPATPVVAEIDEARMEQVLLNLLRNAMDAASSRVALELVPGLGDVTIRITDDGPGVETEGPIWDAFFSTKANGTGLGLAIVHRIVTDHGGNVAVQRDAGLTVFRVDLPLADPERAPQSLLPIG